MNFSKHKRDIELQRGLISVLSNGLKYTEINFVVKSYPLNVIIPWPLNIVESTNHREILLEYPSQCPRITIIGQSRI